MSFFRRQWFLLALLIAAICGVAFPSALRMLSQLPGLRSGMVACVLFLMGITVPARAFAHSFRAPIPGLLALSLNMLAVPLLAAAFASTLPAPLAGGLIVAGAVPCTLASALAWTRKGGGNEVIPMMVMLVTNGLCFVIAPVTLLLLLGRSVDIDTADQVRRLAFLVVLPLCIAAVLRLRAPIACWADAHKIAITNVALTGILVMVAFGTAASFGNPTEISSAANRSAPRDIAADLTSDINRPLSPEQAGETAALDDTGGLLGWGWVTVAGAAAALVHSIVLFGGWYASGWLGLAREERVAVAIAGSQKTLMVGLQISLDCGVSTIPMTFYHASQLLIDTVFVARRKREMDATAAPAATDEPEMSPR